MAKEKSNPLPASVFHHGDIIVPTKAELRSCGIWRVTERRRSLIFAQCRVNGEIEEKDFWPSEIMRKIGVGDQMDFRFTYDEVEPNI